MQVRADVPLASFTTFGLGGPARAFVDVKNDEELVAALTIAHERDLEVFVLGGGSNLVVADEGFDGLVVRVASSGVDVVAREGERVVVRVAAGAAWDPFVAWTIEHDLAGVECLSGIPGRVGATPIQNVGAYGQEVSDTIVRVHTLDRASLEPRTHEARDCAFAYRDSIFKHARAGEIVTAVDFALTAGGAPAIRYDELARALHGERATLASVRAQVIALRRGKSMVIDPGDPNRRSAGSFFVNPIVDRATADDVVARALHDRIVGSAVEVPRFPAGDRVKLSAGWLVERAGFPKGTRRGPVGVSSKHALALVHHGGGTTRALLALADEIVAAVDARFGVRLRREPVLLGASSR